MVKIVLGNCQFYVRSMSLAYTCPTLPLLELCLGLPLHMGYSQLHIWYSLFFTFHKSIHNGLMECFRHAMISSRHLILISSTPRNVWQTSAHEFPLPQLGFSNYCNLQTHIWEWVVDSFFIFINLSFTPIYSRPFVTTHWTLYTT